MLPSFFHGVNLEIPCYFSFLVCTETWKHCGFCGSNQGHNHMCVLQWTQYKLIISFFLPICYGREKSFHPYIFPLKLAVHRGITASSPTAIIGPRTSILGEAYTQEWSHFGSRSGAIPSYLTPVWL